MKKVIVTILTLLISTVFAASYQLSAVEGYGLTSTPGYLEYSGPGVNDGKEPTLNYFEKDNSLFFDFSLPMYEVGGDGYYSNFWATWETRADGYTLFISDIVGPYHPKIWHTAPVIKTYEYIVLDNRGTRNDIIKTSDISYLEFYEDNGSFWVILKKSDYTIYSSVKVVPGEELAIYYTNSNPISDYSSLPTTNDVKYPATITSITGGYQITIPIKSQLYTIQVDNLPSWLVTAKEVYYTTDSAQNRLLFGLYGGDQPFYSNGTFDDKILRNSFIAYNIITGSYQRSEREIVHAKTYTLGNNFASYNELYADVVIPHDIDVLSAITVSYRYKHKYLDGSTSKNWTDVNQQVLLEGQSSHIVIPWWTDITRWTTLITTRWNITDQKQIEKLTITDAYKQEYVTWLRDHGSGTYNVNDIFTSNSNVYKLFLGTYDKFWSVGVYTEKFAVINYRYLYDGVEYSNPFPITEAPDMSEPSSPGDVVKELLAAIWGFFLKYSWIILIVVGIYTAQFPIKAVQIITGNKKVKNRFWIVTLWTALLLGGWYLITLGL